MTNPYILSQGEEESPIAYFAALLTALESAAITEQQTAIVYLLSLVIPSVPQPILRAKFAPSSKLLFAVLEAQVRLRYFKGVFIGFNF